MMAPTAAGSSSMGWTAIVGTSSSTLWPESSDREKAVLANAMLINSAIASFCLSVSNMRTLQHMFHGLEHLFIGERLRNECGSSFRLGQSAGRGLDIGA